MSRRVLENSLAVGAGESIGDEENRVRLFTAHRLERIFEIIGFAQAQRLDADKAAILAWPTIDCSA